MSPLHTQVSFKIEDTLKKMLKGSVPVISTGDLADLIKCESDWLILDSRELVEFKTSHLPNAKWVGDHDFSICRLSGTPKDTNVVVYCSIGVRSEKIAEKLIASGFSNVWNLYGGIFAWANEHKTLIELNQTPTLAVHGYSQKWATLLEHHIHCKQTK
ncbi:MAG: rhodanese-related sulfurtransferase [Paraglaciecola sp.]|jgi:rhodanese-related sulfurtransferase|uniref:rhodanese-like domain-containing protein n=1 Tax=uncultured Paraglaciecola sp. TaxID=1765024 RepID=UPI0025E71FAE|nr:rhodanese-like domain-containing protein [uncultured Paraglaciecola sp.]